MEKILKYKWTIAISVISMINLYLARDIRWLLWVITPILTYWRESTGYNDKQDEIMKEYRDDEYFDKLIKENSDQNDE